MIECDQYAVIVAGSKGFWNYRHQADSCHVYKTLIKKGVKSENIVVMMYDDIAYAQENPFQGQIFNKGTYEDKGEDVYNGCNIDYRGDQVNIENFKKVMLGQPNDNRVLQSGPQDHVFVYFCDHGAAGLIAFPDEYLYASDLLDIFTQMHSGYKYSQLAFYLETCYSGSMMKGLEELGVYGVSAASATEESWACWCGPGSEVDGVQIGTCLGDVFSLAFIQDTLAADTLQETLQQQFINLNSKTIRYSTPGQYGDTSFTQQTISTFFAHNYTQSTYQQPQYTQNNQNNSLNYLQNRYLMSQSQKDLLNLNQHLNIIEIYHNRFQILQKYYNLDNIKYVDDVNCVKQILPIYEQICGQFDQSQFKYINYLAQICNKPEFKQNIQQFYDILTNICAIQNNQNFLRKQY